MLEISGRELCGIGGGTPFGTGLSVGVLLGLGEMVGFLFNPPNPDCLMLFSSATEEGGGRRRLGRLGGASSVDRSDCVSRSDGRRGGSRGAGDVSGRADGRAGGGGPEDVVESVRAGSGRMGS